MNKKEIDDLIDNYFSLERKREAVISTFGFGSPFTKNCSDQFTKISRQIMENHLEEHLLDRSFAIDEEDESNSVQIDFREFGGIDIADILLKDPYKISHVEFNILVYYAVNQILDLSEKPNYWSEMNREVFLLNYEKEYIKLKRCPIIDDILS